MVTMTSNTTLISLVTLDPSARRDQRYGTFKERAYEQVPGTGSEYSYLHTQEYRDSSTVLSR